MKTLATAYTKGNWAFVGLTTETGRYLCKLYQMYWWNTKKLLPPMNGYHITISSPYDGNVKYKFNRKKYEVFIELTPYTNGNAWWYPVKSPQISEWRLSLGLSAEPGIPLHYCIGYERDGRNYEPNVRIC